MNPLSLLKNTVPLTNQSQSDLSFVFVIASLMEAAYVSGGTDRLPGRYMVEQLEAAYGVHCPAVVRIRSIMHGVGQIE